VGTFVLSVPVGTLVLNVPVLGFMGTLLCGSYCTYNPLTPKTPWELVTSLRAAPEGSKTGGMFR